MTDYDYAHDEDKDDDDDDDDDDDGDKLLVVEDALKFHKFNTQILAVIIISYIITLLFVFRCFTLFTF